MREKAKENNITLSEDIISGSVTAQKRLLAERNLRFATL